MNAPSRSTRRVPTQCLIGSTIILLSTFAPRTSSADNTKPSAIQVKLSEWKVSLTPGTVPPGPVVLDVTNSGKIPHALEVEGPGMERTTARILPGDHATLRLNLREGTYEAYCPVGRGSHKMLGMTTHLEVGGSKPASTANGVAGAKSNGDETEEYGAAAEHAEMHGMVHTQGRETGHQVQVMRVSGGGPVIQILPGPFPFADSAMVVIRTRPDDQQADLTKKAQMGPYSNHIAKITGSISLTAIDRGASGDSVSGVAEFAAQDGALWRVVLDRVQTKDIPFNPRFGGVIMGLFYHGASGVHTPLVPTIQSSLALWAYAHLYRNGALVTDNALVHAMLLSRTRRAGDWALNCWDCSNQPIEELQLRVTAAPNTPAFAAPGGFLFVNWEKSSGHVEAL